MELQSYNNKKSGKEKRIMKTRGVLSEHYLVFGSFITTAAFMNAQVPQFHFVQRVLETRKGFGVFLSEVHCLVTPFL